VGTDHRLPGEYEAERLRHPAAERQREITGAACSRLAREDVDGFAGLAAGRLAMALRRRIIRRCDGASDETVSRTGIDDLPELKRDLQRRPAALDADAQGLRPTAPVGKVAPPLSAA
jgi:hypothetical protein